MIHFTSDTYENHVPQHLLSFFIFPAKRSKSVKLFHEFIYIPFSLCRKNNNFRKDNNQKKNQRAKPSSGKRQETIKINEKKNYTSWSSSSSAMAHNNVSWIFSRAKNRDESRKETMKSDWLFDRASSRKRFHDLNKAEWYNRKVYGKHCDENGDCETIDYVSPKRSEILFIKTQNLLKLISRKNLVAEKVLR